MASACCTRGTSYDGLNLTTNVSALWSSGAAFLLDGHDFELSVTVPHRPFSIGIAPKDCDWSRLIASSGHSTLVELGVRYGLFVQFDEGVYIRDGSWTGPTPAKKLPGLPRIQPGAVIRMEFKTAPLALSLAVNGSTPVLVNESAPVVSLGLQTIPHVLYAPFVNLGTSISIKAKASVIDSPCSRRRKFSDHGADHNQRMWKDREFTDAEIVTASGTIPVHRAILCCSAHFKAAFTGGYQESANCTIRIDDAAHMSVEAFIQFLYTGDLADGVDLAEVLKLAHRYQQDDLVKICAESMLKALNEDTVCETVRCLRLMRQTPSVAAAWQELEGKIRDVPELRTAVLVGL